MILFALMSCKKDTYESNGNANIPVFPQQPYTYEISHPDLANFLFKSGTYWVYVDSISNLIDSIHVDTFYLDSLVYDANYWKHHVYNTTSYPSMETTTYAVQPFGAYKGFNGAYNSGQKIYVGYEFSYYANCLSDTIGLMFVFDQFYTNVVRVHVPIDPAENNNQSFYYINSDYGILRHDVYSGVNLISKEVLMNKNIVK